MSESRAVDWIALRDIGMRADSALRTRIGVWRAAFARESAQDWALHHHDVHEFAAALFGAWHAGKTVWLPGDALPQTRAALASRIGGFAGDADGDLQAAGEGAPPLDALDEDATRLVVFTSGSSGEASAIPKRLAQLAREVESLETCFGERVGRGVVHATVSHQHIYGLLFRVLWPLAAGREIASRRVVFHEDMFAALQQQPGVLVSSPAHLKRLPEGLDWPALRGCVRAVFSSGGALPVDAAQDASARLGQSPIEIYGSSETGGIAWRDHSDAAWQPLPGVAWRVGDDRLQVRSPHLPEDAWFVTQDRAVLDAVGGFRLLGRADRIVKIEERRVSLTALEGAVRNVGLVDDVRVLLLDGARSVLAAVCVPNAAGRDALQRLGKTGVTRTLRTALGAGHDPVAMPRRWRFVDALPLNAQGKTTDAALRALFRPHEPELHWLRREPTHAALAFDTTPDLLVFDGHFPQAPVLPGVAQVDWAVRCARQAFSLPPRLLRMEAIKFQRVVGADRRVELTLDWAAERGVLTFAMRSDAGPHSSGRLIFGEAASA